jgi:hypothetical protein
VAGDQWPATWQLAFLGGDGEEGGDFLVDMGAPTLRALGFTFFVFLQGEDQFEGLLAIFTIKLVARHNDLQEKLGPVGSDSVCTLGEGRCQDGVTSES